LIFPDSLAKVPPELRKPFKNTTFPRQPKCLRAC
jgi:hypothetical protein